MTTKGTVFDIKGAALGDGPGIRTTVFLKGCPLRCDWCHNPESQSSKPVVAQFPHNCIDCGTCLTCCPNGALSRGPETVIINRHLCQGCGKCVRACPTRALLLRGRIMTVAQVMSEVRKACSSRENPCGGMTVSGGEPLYQPEFTLALLRAAKSEGIHTCLDTCGYAPWGVLEQILPYVDMVLYDLKGVNPALHRARTGRPNSMIMQNLQALISDGSTVKVRMPVVPGYNDTEEAIRDVARFMADLGRVPALEMLPYQPLGESKYEAFGIKHGLRLVPPVRSEMEALAEVVREFGVECEVVG